MSITRSTILFLCLFFAENIQGQTKIDLDQPWFFTEVGQSNWLPATVPGVIHTDLLGNKLIADPYWENNELKQQWIGEKNWQYKTDFFVNDTSQDPQHIDLIFEGLDTYASVWLNGHLILKSNNMFRQWRVPVKRFIKSGKNELLIQFTSPLAYNRYKHDHHPYVLPSGCENGKLNVGAYTRKAAYHFGWDWGPRFVTAGIWRPIKFHIWNDVRIKSAVVRTEEINKGKAKLSAELRLDVASGAPGVYKLRLKNQLINGKQKGITIGKRLALKAGFNKVQFEFEIDDPELWWANGEGTPNLYLGEFILENEDRTAILCTKTIKYGIRTVELINEKDTIGTAFYFKLNGKPLFMKGANYIPQDLFLPRVSSQQYETLIKAVKSANMNMLRVWGGGIYENDLFYDLCDANGILVWQDFMFAGSLYPSDTAFLNNVKQEVEDNILRLRSHPSIAIWCGNNEIEMAWKNWGWQSQYGIHGNDSIQAWQTYEYLFHELIPDLVERHDGTRPYTSTSPLSNWGKLENFNHGSMHYWGVWHGRDPFELFNKFVGRFMVEYGFQSFPSMSTIKTFAADSSRYLTSTVMVNRQKSYIGNGLILDHIKQYGAAPTNFKEFVVLSQKIQAKGLGMAINAHMAKQPHCMGTLFWQLNDCWPGPSWSVIDYYGRKKIAYKTVKRAFSTQN